MTRPRRWAGAVSWVTALAVVIVVIAVMPMSGVIRAKVR
jgi:hypothetical protein